MLSRANNNNKNPDIYTPQLTGKPEQ